MRLPYCFLCRITTSYAILLCFFLLERYSGPPKAHLMLPRKYYTINTHKINTTSLHEIYNVSVLYFMSVRNIQANTFEILRNDTDGMRCFYGFKRRTESESCRCQTDDIKLLFPEFFTALSVIVYSHDNCTSWFEEASNRRLKYLERISTVSEKEKKDEIKYWVQQLQCAHNLHQSQRYDILNNLLKPIRNNYWTISQADGMSYPRKGIIGRTIELEDKMEYLINFLQKKEGKEPVVWVAEWRFMMILTVVLHFIVLVAMISW